MVAHVNREFMVKYLDISKKDKRIVKLVAGNPRYETIILHGDDELTI